MRAKWWTVAVELAVVVGLSLYLGSARPVQTTDTMSSLLSMIQSVAQDENWERAAALGERLSDVWDQERLRVAINHAEQPFNSFEVTLSRLQGGVLAQDRSAVITQATVALNTWSNTLQPLVPLP